MKEPNHYAVLQISRTASNKEIREAYVRRLRDTHPDVERLSNYPVVRLDDIQQAYRCLCNDETRATHDAELLAVELSRAARLRRVRRQTARGGIIDADQKRHRRGLRAMPSRQRLLLVMLLLAIAVDIYNPEYLDSLIGLDKILPRTVMGN